MDEVMLLDPRTFLVRPKLTLRGALPSEYLRRWAIMADVFGVPTNYLGNVANPSGEPQMVVVQPYVDQADSDPALIEDIAVYLSANGFEKVDPSMVALPEVADVTWYRQSDGILLSDAHARNFRKETTTGALVPVDLVLNLVPPGTSKLLPPATSPWQWLEK